MKKQYFIYGAIIILVAVGVVLYQQIIRPQLEARTISVVVPTIIKNDESFFEFTYPSGEDGFALIEPPLPPETSDGLNKVYLMMENQAYIDFQNTKDTETPPSVSVFVFRMPDDLEVSEGSAEAQLEAWAKKYGRYTSYDLKTSDLEAITVDSIDGFHYFADGLYRQETYLLSYRGNVYMFTGQYDQDSDATRVMFTNLIDSVIFY